MQEPILTANDFNSTHGPVGVGSFDDTGCVDDVRPRDYTERIHLGAEYKFLDTFALRGGYKFNYDAGALSLGFG